VKPSYPVMWIKFTGVLDGLVLTPAPTPPPAPNEPGIVTNITPTPRGSDLRERITIRDQEISPSSAVRDASFFVAPDFIPGEEEFLFAAPPSTPGPRDAGPKDASYIPVVRGAWTHTPPSEADVWDVEVVLRDMPVDPRIYRYLEVEVVMTTEMDADPSTSGVVLGTGVVDEITTSHGMDGVVVRMSGRDLSAALRDTVWTGVGGVRHIEISGARISDVIATIMDLVGAFEPRGRFVTLELSRITSDLDVDLGLLLGRRIYTPGEGDSVWDVCTALASLVGLEFSAENRLLFLQTPQFFNDSPGFAYIYGGPLGSCESLELTRNIGTSTGIRDVVVRARNLAERKIYIGISIPVPGVSSDAVVEYPVPPGAWQQRDVDLLAQLIYAAQSITTLDGRVMSSAVYPPDPQALSLITPFAVSTSCELRARDTIYVSTTTWSPEVGEAWIAQRFGVRADLGSIGDAYLYAIRRIAHTYDMSTGYTADIDIMMPLALRQVRT
jgi:hypothetical protein